MEYPKTIIDDCQRLMHRLTKEDYNIVSNAVAELKIQYTRIETLEAVIKRLREEK